MCRIKTGKEITQIHEVQNLITAYILRSKEPYVIPSISDAVEHSCQGSDLSIPKDQIIEMVQETTMTLLRAKFISLHSGQYYVLPAVLKKG